MRKGNINTLTKKGEKKFIYDVCFVPLLKHNLMSIGQLLQKGYRIFFKRKQCTILHKFPSIQLTAKVQIPKVKTRFEGRIGSKTPSTKSQEDEEKTTTLIQVIFQEKIKHVNWLWHLRYGHLNFGPLNLFYKKRMVNGLPLIEKPDRIYESCILGKQHRESFPTRKSIHPNKPLDIVH